MRCLSCGFMNAPQAFECTKCNYILDPFAAAATVSVHTANKEAFANSFDTMNGAALPPLPNFKGIAPPPLPASMLPRPVSFSTEPPRRNLVSTDLEFLLDSEGSSRLQTVQTLPNGVINMQSQPNMIECSRCHRVLKPDLILVAQIGQAKPICLDCQSRMTTKEEGATRREQRLRLAGGFGLGLVAGGVCVALSAQYGIDATKHEINWAMTLVIGLIIGLGVRLGGGFIKPGTGLQLLGLGLGAVTLLGCIYICLNNLNGQTLSFNDALAGFQKLKVDLMSYFLMGLSLLIAFVIPSGIIGGHDDAMSASV